MVANNRQQGSVTILTLLVILFLTTLALGLAGQIRTQVNTVTLVQQETRARYAAEAGINLALAEIMNHPQNFRPQWQEVLAALPQCSTNIAITKGDSSYSIHSDGQSGGIHQKVTATVKNYPGPQAEVLIQSSYVNQ
jgi:Tfp pilus assembly protein PilX